MKEDLDFLGKVLSYSIKIAITLFAIGCAIRAAMWMIP